MDFQLNEEQAAMEQMARNFAEKEVVPNLKKEEFNRDLVRKMGELGLFGCAFPEGMGGSASGFLAHSVVCEQISTYDSGLRALFNLQAMTVPYTMMEWGSDAVRKKYVKALVTGEKLGCTCFSEPNAGSDIAAIETKVVDKGDHFLINGSKTWISNGTVAEYAVVYCTFDRSLKHNGLCAIVVETNQPGWQPHEIPKLGDKASPIAEIGLEDVVAPKENLLGEWGGGFKVAMTALDRGRISVGSGALGICQACLNASVKYANERVQFGRPIRDYQMVKHLIADMVVLHRGGPFPGPAGSLAERPGEALHPGDRHRQVLCRRGGRARRRVGHGDPRRDGIFPRASRGEILPRLQALPGRGRNGQYHAPAHRRRRPGGEKSQPPPPEGTGGFPRPELRVFAAESAEDAESTIDKI